MNKKQNTAAVGSAHGAPHGATQPRLARRSLALRPVALAAALAASVMPLHALPVSWTNNASSFWDIATNWNAGVLPGAADDVTLGLAGARTITYRQAVTSINSLAITGANTLAVTGGTLNVTTLNNSALITMSGGALNVGSGNSGTVNLGGGTLGLTGTLTATGLITLQGGGLAGGTVQQSAANGLRFSNNGGSTLTGVTVRGAMTVGDATNTSGRVRISNSLTVLTEAGASGGVINVGTVAGATGAVIGFTGTQTFDNATINLGNATQNGFLSQDGAGTLTLGSGAVVQGRGNLGSAVFLGGTSNLVNNGVISANISGATLAINNSGTLTNNGLLEARNGAALNLSVTGGSNAGIIRVVDATSTVNIGGSFSNGALGSFDNLAGGNLNLTGTLLNTGSTLAFSATTGSMRLLGGQVTGGTIQQSGTNGLKVTNSIGFLDGVTHRGTVNVGDAANISGRVRISNGLTVLTEAGAVGGVVNVGTVAGATNAVIGFTGTQTFDNATLTLGNATQSGTISQDGAGTFTLGTGALVQGRGTFGGAQFLGGTNNLVNNGTISAHISAGSLTVNNSGTLTNNGLLEARNGGTLNLTVTGGSNAGVIRVVDATSTVNLGGSLSNSALGSFDNVAGGNLNLTGTLLNTGNTLTFSPSTGSLRLVGGQITGGTVQQSGANGLKFGSSQGTLDGVTHRGTMTVGDAANVSGRVRISNGLTVLTEAGAAGGVVNVGTVAGATGAIIGFTGTQTFDNATLTLGSATQNASLSQDGAGTFTLGLGAVVQGRGSLGGASFVGGTSNLVNNGTVSAHISGGALNINNSGTLTNNGTLEARNGGTLNLSVAGGSNAGVIRVVDATSTVNLGGTTTNAALGSFDNVAGGNLNLTGTLVNTGGTLAFSAATGSMRLVGGQVTGGTLQQSGSNGLKYSNSGGTLDGVTSRGALTVGDAVNPSGRVRISTGLTVLTEAGAAGGVVNVGTVAGATNAVIGFTGTQTFDGATLTLGNATQNATLSQDGVGTFTLGTAAVVQGRGNLGQANFLGGTSNLVNNGTISAHISGGTLTVNNSGTLTNNGTLEARNGGTLNLATTGGGNSGVIRVFDAASTVNIGGSLSNSALGVFDNVAAGNLNLTGTLVNTGATLAFSAATGSMRIVGGQVTGGTVQQSGSNSLKYSSSGGTLDGVTHRGTMTVGDAANPSGRVRIGNGLTVLSEAGTGPGFINVGTVAGATSAVIGFTGTQTFDNATVTLGNATQNASLSQDGVGTFTLGTAAVVQGRGSLGQANFLGGTSNLVNNGTVSANVSAGTLTLNNSGSLTHNGLLEARNGGTLTIGSGGGFGNFSSNTLLGGSYAVIGTSILQFTGANIVTNGATILLDGSGSVLRNTNGAVNALANFASNTAAGSFTIRNGRNLTTVGAFNNAGIVNVGTASTFGGGAFSNVLGSQLQMAGGTFASASLTNAGLLTGFGTVTPAVANTGGVLATGGTLTLAGGVQGGTGTVTVGSAASLAIGAGSTAATLAHDGTLLALGANSFTVLQDYTNSNAGTGNSFVARAGVTGTGQVVGANAAQAVSGQVALTAPNTYLVSFGNVRGGTSSTRVGQLVNSGTGANIRGALQTGGPGLGNVTDGRLSGSGVTASNFGPIGAGGNSADIAITLTAGTSGGSLSGQRVVLVSNFDNVPAQTINISGFSTVLALGQATPGGPLNLGNFRVGIAPPASGFISASNLGTSAGAENLGIGSVLTTGNFAAVNLLGAGLVSPNASFPNAVGLTSSGGVAGINNGNVAVQFTTNGSSFDASFITQASNLQNVALTASGYLVAQPTLPTAPVTVGNYRLPNGASSGFTVFNTNTAPAGFQELLNVAIGTPSAGVVAAGGVTGLAPGAGSNTFSIGFAPGGAAGLRNGSTTLSLISNGTGSSGLGNFTLATGTVAVAGTAFNIAAGAATPSPVTVAAQRVGGSGSVLLAVANTAPAGVFTEALNVSFAGNTGAATHNGGAFSNLAAGAVNSTALAVGVNTASAGLRTGTVTLAYQTDGTGSNGFSGLAATGLGNQQISVSGNVYAPAVAQLGTSAINFGIVRVGDVVAARNVAVTNAASGALTDTLRATLGGSAEPFASAGTVAGLAAGASNTSSLLVQLSTATAGIFNSTATATLTSQNPEMADLPLASQAVGLTAQVNNLAAAVLAKTGGSGSFSNALGGYTLNFGSFEQGTAGVAASLRLVNGADPLAGPADALAGSFDLSQVGVGSGFTLSGFGNFAGLAAGSAINGLTVNFGTGALGSFDVTVLLNPASTNSGAPDLNLATVQLRLQGTVVAVPEPGTYVLMVGGLLLLARRVRVAAAARRAA